MAREAGTSGAVVSYVVNGGPRNVAEPTRRRVLRAIEKLDYRPNAHARSLRSSTSTVLGLVVSDITNAYCAELALAVETAALDRGHTLLLGNTTSNDDRQARHLRTFLEHQVKGILFVGSSDGDEVFSPVVEAVLEGRTSPLVFLDRSTSAFGAAAIRVDNRQGATDATDHLLDHGHRQIVNFAGSSLSSAVRERTAGWQDSLTARGIDWRSQRAVDTQFDRYKAFAAARALFNGRPRPSAIFSHSDEQSIGILHAAAEAGVRIPEDLALASFDGIKEASIVAPGLTTVQQPIAHLAKLAIDRVLDPHGPERTSSPENALVPVHLVVRNSCGCA